MSNTAKTTKLGVVTAIDEDFIYVWSSLLGINELKFPHNPETQFEPGDLVAYIQSNEIDEVQNVNELFKEEEPGSIVIEKIHGHKDLKWKAQVNLTFLPTNSPQYQKIKQGDEDNRIKALAYVDDFLFVVDNLMAVPSFVEDVQYEVGRVYKAYIGRFPKKPFYDSLAPKFGTIFFVLGKKFDEPISGADASNMLLNCPWNRKTIELQQNDKKLTMSMDSMCFTQQSDNQIVPNLISRPQLSFYDDEPLADNYAENIRPEDEDAESIGVIVRCEPHYSIIWSPNYDLVRIQLGYNEKQDPHNSPQWPLCQWVHFRCFKDQSQLNGGTLCQYSAYIVRKIRNGPKEVDQIAENDVVAKLELNNLQRHSRQFSLAEDSFFSKVLCSCHDSTLTHQLERSTSASPVEVQAIYTEHYKFSKWVVFSVMDTEDNFLRKVNGLPASIENRIRPFLQQQNPSASNLDATQPAQGEMQNEIVDAIRFKPPSDWKGVVFEEDKISDVLGIVVGFDSNQDSIVATRYGVARHPNKIVLGTWMRTTLLLETDPPPGQRRLLHLDSYVVIRSTKIAPPISTRIVNDTRGEKLIICCQIKWVDHKLENDYLGIVLDRDGLIPTTIDKSSQNGYLVEIGLARGGPLKNDLFWNVLENHGKYTGCVNTVALKLSHCPNSMGRTCDDAYTVLLDQDFVDPKLVARRLKLNPQPSAAISQHKPNIFYEDQNRAENVDAPSPTIIMNNYVDTRPFSPMTQSELRFGDLQETGYVHNQEQFYLYQPVEGHSKRFFGLVVVKAATHAILYTKDCGDAIALLRYSPSQEDFDTRFELGQFLGVNFSPVDGFPNNGLQYGWMCTPKYRKSKPRLPVRILFNNLVQVQIECEFRLEDIYSSGDQLIVDTKMGTVLVKRELVTENNLLGKVVKCWVSHVPKNYGCYWEIIGNDTIAMDDFSIVGQLARPPSIWEEIGAHQPKMQLHQSSNQQGDSAIAQSSNYTTNLHAPQAVKSSNLKPNITSATSEHVVYQQHKQIQTRDEFEGINMPGMTNSERYRDGRDLVQPGFDNDEPTESDGSYGEIILNTGFTPEDSSQPLGSYFSTNGSSDFRCTGSSPPTSAHHRQPVAPFSFVPIMPSVPTADRKQYHHSTWKPLGFDWNGLTDSRSQGGSAAESHQSSWENISSIIGPSGLRQQAIPSLLLDFDDFMMGASMSSDTQQQQQQWKEEAEKRKKKRAEEERKKKQEEMEQKKKKEFDNFMSSVVEAQKRELLGGADLLQL